MSKLVQNSFSSATGNAPAPNTDYAHAPDGVVEHITLQSASNDVPKQKPIAAVDAIALCMQASTFGG
ncbi:MAG: hypothetical protein ABJB01_05745 [Rudaea sp.]